jgi:hypothetical protein
VCPWQKGFRVLKEKSPKNAHSACFSGFLVLLDLVSEVPWGLVFSEAEKTGAIR